MASHLTLEYFSIQTSLWLTQWLQGVQDLCHHPSTAGMRCFCWYAALVFPNMVLWFMTRYLYFGLIWPHLVFSNPSYGASCFLFFKSDYPSYWESFQKEHSCSESEMWLFDTFWAWGEFAWKSTPGKTSNCLECLPLVSICRMMDFKLFGNCPTALLRLMCSKNLFSMVTADVFPP